MRENSNNAGGSNVRRNGRLSARPGFHQGSSRSAKGDIRGFAKKGQSNVAWTVGNLSNYGDLADYSIDYSASLNKVLAGALIAGNEMQRFMMPYMGTFYFNAMSNVDTTSLKECIKKQM